MKDDIDWSLVAKLIRKGRMQEFPPELLELIANKIAPVKQRRGRPKNPEANAERFLTGLANIARVKTYNGKTMNKVDRLLWIGKRYDELLNQGIKSVPAMEQICADLYLSFKSIEADVTFLRKMPTMEYDIIWNDETKEYDQIPWSENIETKP